MSKPLSGKFISFDIPIKDYKDPFTFVIFLNDYKSEDISYDAIQKFIQEYISCSSKSIFTHSLANVRQYSNEDNLFKIIYKTENIVNNDAIEDYISNFILALTYLSDIIRKNPSNFNSMNAIINGEFPNDNLPFDIENITKRGILIEHDSNKRIIITFKRLGKDTADLLIDNVINDLTHMHYYNTMSNLSYDDKIYCDDKFYGKIAYNYTVKVPTVFDFNILKGV